MILPAPHDGSVHCATQWYKLSMYQLEHTGAYATVRTYSTCRGLLSPQKKKEHRNLQEPDTYMNCSVQ